LKKHVSFLAFLAGLLSSSPVEAKPTPPAAPDYSALEQVVVAELKEKHTQVR
jgi:hypothetical protein